MVADTACKTVLLHAVVTIRGEDIPMATEEDNNDGGHALQTPQVQAHGHEESLTIPITIHFFSFSFPFRSFSLTSSLIFCSSHPLFISLNVSSYAAPAHSERSRTSIVLLR
jgi:hypothetical protein